MSEGNGNGKAESKGVQAYRWLVAVVMSLLTGFSWNVLQGINQTNERLDALRIQVGTLVSRIDAHVQRLDTIDRRNDRQDTALDELVRRSYRGYDQRGTP